MEDIVITNICSIQVYDSVACGYFCIGFIDLMFKAKVSLTFQIYFRQVSLEIIVKQF